MQAKILEIQNCEISVYENDLLLKKCQLFMTNESNRTMNE